jgi:hypothetical protein
MRDCHVSAPIGLRRELADSRFASKSIFLFSRPCIRIMRRQLGSTRGNLKRVSTTHENLNGPLSRFCVPVGSILLLLTAILVMITPLTDYYWHFDKFLTGGQDFEFGLLSVMSICCLVIVLMKHGKTIVASILMLRQRLDPLPCSQASFMARQARIVLAVLQSEPRPDPVVAYYSLPIQV